VVMREFLFVSKAESMQNQLFSIPRDVLANPDGVGGRGRSPMIFLPDMTLATIDRAGNLTNLSTWPAAGTPPKLTQEQYNQALARRARLHYTIARDDSGIEQLVVWQQLDMRGRQPVIVQLGTATAPLIDVAMRQLFI